MTEKLLPPQEFNPTPIIESTDLGMRDAVGEHLSERAEDLREKVERRVEIEQVAPSLITAKVTTPVARTRGEERQARRASRRMRKRFLIGFEKALLQTQLEGFNEYTGMNPDETAEARQSEGHPPSEIKAVEKTGREIRRLERQFSRTRDKSTSIIASRRNNDAELSDKVIRLKQKDRSSRFRLLRARGYEAIAQRMATDQSTIIQRDNDKEDQE